MTRGPNKKGTTVYASSCRVYKVSAKFNMYRSRCVFIYNNTHGYISVRRVCKHVQVARWYSLGQHFEVWIDAAETRDKLLRRSQRHRSLALRYMLRNFVPADGHGAWQRLVVHARVAMDRSNDHGICRLCCAEQVKLQRNAFSMF